MNTIVQQELAYNLSWTGTATMIKTRFSVLAILLFTSLAFAQDKSASAGAPGCGAPDTKFEVRSERGQHPAKPEAGEALVYFIGDDSEFEMNPKPTTRIGVDGEWVGATHGNSYFYFSVDPGVHHLCASWQPALLLLKVQKTAEAHFTAEAGGAYYFEVKNTWWRDRGGTGIISLEPLDSDEGQLLANKFSFSSSQPKK